MGLSPCRTVSQHSTATKHLPLHHSLSKHTIQMAYVSGLHSDLHSHKPGLVHFSPRCNSRTPFFQSLTHLQTAQLTEAKGISGSLSSSIVTRSIKPSLSSQTAFFHFFATLFRQPLSGTSFGLPEVFNQ